MSEITRLLTKTKFKYLWMSQIFSQVAINMMNFLILIRLFNHTGSTLAVSFLWISYALPTILVGPIASAMVDIVDKRKVLILTNLGQFLVIAFSSFIVRNNVFLLYGVTFFYSLLNQFYGPSESAMVPKLVDKSQLPNANSLFFITQQLSLILGFAVAGIINGLFGFNISLMLCGSLLFFATISVLFIPDEKNKDVGRESFENSFIQFFKTLFEGYSYLKNKKFIYIPFFLLLGIQACFAVVIVCVPIIARDILKVDTNLSGVLLVVPAGIGAVIGAAYFPKFLKIGWRKRNLIEIGSMTLGILFTVYSLFLGYLPPMIRIIVSFIMIMFVGVFFIALIIPTQTFLQEVTPEGLRGRIFGNMWFLITITQVLPIVFSGALVELFGVRLLLIIIASYCWAIFYFSKKSDIKLLIS
ncbi:MAG TPA: MFS transporter [Patescibacteria group bacterium]|nr:MFS transporter [Patescibacteria group bacterium]